ncbi:MAG: YfhE family protein [Bacillus sp. (in: firmicutes)]
MEKRRQQQKSKHTLSSMQEVTYTHEFKKADKAAEEHTKSKKN